MLRKTWLLIITLSDVIQVIRSVLELRHYLAG